MPRDSHDILTDPPPPAATERLAYGDDPLQFGDLRLPPEDGPFALAVVLHGGYWQATYNLIHTGHMCVALAEAGVATWNVEYRRIGDVGGGWPRTGDDVAQAVAFVGELPLEPTSVLLVGHSAGGQLALWATRRAKLPVVALAPVSDVRDSVRRGGPGAAPERFVGESRFDELSPLELLPLGARQVVVHGTADESVPYEMSERYVAAAGGEAELVTLEGTGHFELIDPQAREWPLVLSVIRSLL